MGTSISCVSADDDQSWEWTKGLMQVPLALSRLWGGTCHHLPRLSNSRDLQVLGPDRIMGLAIGLTTCKGKRASSKSAQMRFDPNEQWQRLFAQETNWSCCSPSLPFQTRWIRHARRQHLTGQRFRPWLSCIWAHLHGGCVVCWTNFGHM